MASGLVIAAPASGSGKTVITLSLLRAMRNAGITVSSIKIGPDYIDPAYHSAASGELCQNLDLWGMRNETLIHQRASAVGESDVVIVEGVMGLFDGAVTGKSINSGSTADAAKWLDWPIILVVDAKGQGASVTALVEGFVNHRDDIKIAGVIFNRIGSENHERILREALSNTNVPCLGCIPRHDRLNLPHRHLGLIQAREMRHLNMWLDEAANLITSSVDLDLLCKLSTRSKIMPTPKHSMTIPMLGKHTSVARDNAFSFCYDYVVGAWQAGGVKVTFFSPLAGEAPHPHADSIYLPGGYPELYAAEISENQKFKETMKIAAINGSVIYGECGGFMVLGGSLIDRDGISHEMLDLLPIKTSFAKPKLHLGYRQLSLIDKGILGDAGATFKGHEFHYCNIVEDSKAESLFYGYDARGEKLPAMGSKRGSVMGSFSHIIDSV
nr:cobyrinate a,c-diamide synthase [Rhodospirillales bacterium]